MPSQVVYPGVLPTKSTDPRDDYTVGGKKLSDPSVKGILPVARSFERVKAQIDAHYATWTTAASDLSTGRDSLSNTKFGGAVVGALGAIVSKVDVTKLGAATAGGAGVWDSQYQLQVQAGNYRLAADAMRCIHTKVTKLPPAFWSATYDTSSGREGSMKLSIDEYKKFAKDDDDLIAGYNRLQLLFETINASITVVRDRLQVKQESVTIATPSAEAIQNALQGAAENKKKSEDQAKALKGDVPEQRSDLDEVENLAANLGKGTAAEAGRTEGTQQQLQRHSSLLKRILGDYAGAPAIPNQAQLKRIQERVQALKRAPEITKQDYEVAMQLPAELNTCTAQISK
jgi:hypothetical protein